MRYGITIGIVCGTLWGSGALGAVVADPNETPEQKGLAIIQEADRRSSGYGDLIASLTMTLRNKQGQESLREMRIQTLEVKGDGDKSLCIFDTPKDVKGTALLTYVHKTGDDDQWLYLPALKRVKRISAANKSGSFMGSEFSYEDIASQELEKYTYRWVRDETYEGQECFVVERQPVDRRYSAYTRQVVWIDKSEYRTQKADYYDRKQMLLKTLTFREHQQYLGKFWRPGEMNMVNHQTGKSTQLVWSKYQFQTGLTDSDFSQSALMRAR